MSDWSSDVCSSDLPAAAVYSNDMLVGALVIAFSVLVPMMPGMSMAGMMDPKVVPPGWTYSPSTAAQRLPIVIMGVVGLLISRHLTAYQLGHLDRKSTRMNYSH